MFAGIDNKARKSAGAYIGVDGVARRAKKLYMGVDGKARLCWEAGGSSEGGTDSTTGVRAYLYNGVKLPKLPVVPAGYENVHIVSIVDASTNEVKYWQLYFDTERPYTFYQNGFTNLVEHGFDNDNEGSHFVYKTNDAGTNWEFASSVQPTVYAYGLKLDRVVWANYDVLNMDGTTYLEASDPVPLYSYNGVELPELPGAVKDYRYIWVRRIPTYILKKAYWVLAQNTISYSVSDTGAECINVPASSLRYRYYVETDPSDWVIAPIEDDGDDRIATKGWLVWSNFPMLDTTDTIIMPASAPQPVYL